MAVRISVHSCARGPLDLSALSRLPQRAVQKFREKGRAAAFIAVRLPSGIQAVENDALAAVAIIRPDRVVTVDIKPAADCLMAAVVDGGSDPLLRHHFIPGNVKERQRMSAQYAIAVSGIVIGTDNAAEAVMGSYTKFGDGAADVLPLAGLNKRRVRAVATALGAPDQLVWKVPTADLESDAPLRPDEDIYGVTYDQIDDFLEGRAIAPAAAERIDGRFGPAFDTARSKGRLGTRAWQYPPRTDCTFWRGDDFCDSAGEGLWQNDQILKRGAVSLPENDGRGTRTFLVARLPARAGAAAR